MSDADLKEQQEKLQEGMLKLVELKIQFEQEYNDALERIEDESIKMTFMQLRRLMQAQSMVLMNQIQYIFSWTNIVVSPALHKYIEEFQKREESSLDIV